MSTTADELLKRHRLTVDDYHRMGEAGILCQDTRVELIEGEIIDMSPIGSAHAGTVKQLGNLMKLAVGRAAIVSIQDPLVLSEHSEPEPDIALLRPQDDFYKAAHPQAKDVLLILEVADTSLRYDREIKIPLYARSAIPEFWLVDLENHRLLIHHSPGKRGYQTLEVPDDLRRITLRSLPGITLDLSALF